MRTSACESSSPRRQPVTKHTGARCRATPAPHATSSTAASSGFRRVSFRRALYVSPSRLFDRRAAAPPAFLPARPRSAPTPRASPQPAPGRSWPRRALRPWTPPLPAARAAPGSSEPSWQGCARAPAPPAPQARRLPLLAVRGRPPRPPRHRPPRPRPAAARPHACRGAPCPETPRHGMPAVTHRDVGLRVACSAAAQQCARLSNTLLLFLCSTWLCIGLNANLIQKLSAGCVSTLPKSDCCAGRGGAPLPPPPARAAAWFCLRAGVASSPAPSATALVADELRPALFTPHAARGHPPCLLQTLCVTASTRWMTQAKAKPPITSALRQPQQ